MAELREEQRGRARWLTIDRPAQRNALTFGLLGDLRASLARADADAAVRAIALTAEGEKAFCAGADLSGGSIAGQDAPRAYAALLVDLSKLGKPVVAVVNGSVLGGGMGLLAACDLAIAAQDARFGTPEVDLGLFPYMALAPLTRLIGRRAALDLMFTARKIDAAEARSIGLVNRVVPRAELAAQADALLETLAAKSPTALRLGRRAFYATQDLPYEQQLEALCAQLSLNARTEDAAEGVAAFLEKRKPDFKGR
ncbi:MAG: enoyl-CoA hydratase/isomerase family protein [Myxococcales bacterium]|nr:enoyl-CoA hydratase/isomerase family protein [Myxococcales bacterium]